MKKYYKKQCYKKILIQQAIYQCFKGGFLQVYWKDHGEKTTGGGLSAGVQEGQGDGGPAYNEGRQDVDARTWPPGRGCQDVATRTWMPGRGHQDVDDRTWLPGCG